MRLRSRSEDCDDGIIHALTPLLSSNSQGIIEVAVARLKLGLIAPFVWALVILDVKTELLRAQIGYIVLKKND